MHNHKNLIPSEVATAIASKQGQLDQLQQLPAWSESQFLQMIISLRKWHYIRGEWVLSINDVVSRAYDVRLPPRFAQKIRKLVEEWHKNGLIKI